MSCIYGHFFRVTYTKKQNKFDQKPILRKHFQNQITKKPITLLPTLLFLVSYYFAKPNSPALQRI